MGRHHFIRHQDWNSPHWNEVKRKMGTYKSGGGRHRGSRNRGYEIRSTKGHIGKHEASGCALTAFAIISIPAAIVALGGYGVWHLFSTF